MTTPRILLVCATRHGSTKEVADAVAEELRAAGAEVDVRAAGESPDPAAYSAAVVGAPMIMGWHKDALRYVERYRDQLSAMPTAYFVTAMSLTDTGRPDVDGVPIVKDPWLVKAPRAAARLSFKERYARPEHYLGDILQKTRPVRPETVAFFGGALDFTKMNIFEQLFVTFIVSATPGDARNWKAVREWAGGLLPQLARH